MPDGSEREDHGLDRVCELGTDAEASPTLLPILFFKENETKDFIYRLTLVKTGGG